jgi:hypothetical protein
MDDLIKKYYPIIQTESKILWNDYAKTLESCVSYLKDNNEVDKELKVAATFVVKQLFLDDDKFEDKKIEDIIDNFIKHHNSEYENYINSFAMLTDKFDADLSFYYGYVKKVKD